MAHVLLCALRRIALQGTKLANAACGTIRLKLLKIGALVRISVRRIRIAMASVASARRTAAIPQIWAAGRADARASPA
jgi:Transposase DDE domain group 1